MRRLAIGTAAVGVTWGVLHSFGEEIPNLDRWILTGIGAVFGLASVIMLAGTPRWSARTLGVLFTSLATFVLYGIGLTYYGWYQGQPIPNWLLDLGRALFVVGGPLLAYGLAVWVHANWGPPSMSGKPDPMPKYDGENRRGENGGRRHYDPPTHEAST